MSQPTLPGDLPANYITGGTFTAADEDAVELAINQLIAYVNALPRTVPSYVVDPANAYNAALNAYNWKASNTRRIRAALAKAQTASGVANFAFIGESTMAGVSGETGALLTWPIIFRNAMALPIGGTGLVPAINGAPSSDTRWATTGSWQTLAYTLYISASGATATFTSDKPGTVVKVYYFGNSAGMTVAIDGGSAVALTMDATQHAKVYTVTGLADTIHTVTITTTSASYNALIGASVGGANGLVMHNLGVGGSVASAADGFTSAWETTTAGYINPTLLGALTADGITPDVIFCQLGINDHKYGYAESATIEALTSICNQFPNSDFVLVGEYQPTGTPYNNWSEWTAQLYQLADTLNVPFIDYYDRSGGYTITNAAGLMADQFHPTPAGHRDQGTNLAKLASELITPPVVNAVNQDINVHTARDYGFIEWTNDPAMNFTGFQPILAGLLYVSSIMIREAGTRAGLVMDINTAGATLTSGQCFAGLFQGGSLIATTADQHTAWQTTGWKTMPFTTPVVVQPGQAYVAFFANGTTLPKFSVPIASSGNNQVNGGPNTFIRAGYTSNTGLTTAMPATLGGIATVNSPVWAALY